MTPWKCPSATLPYTLEFAPITLTFGPNKGILTSTRLSPQERELSLQVNPSSGSAKEQTQTFSSPFAARQYFSRRDTVERDEAADKELHDPDRQEIHAVDWERSQTEMRNSGEFAERWQPRLRHAGLLPRVVRMHPPSGCQCLKYCWTPVKWRGPDFSLEAHLRHLMLVEARGPWLDPNLDTLEDKLSHALP